MSGHRAPIIDARRLEDDSATVFDVLQPRGDGSTGYVRATFTDEADARLFIAAPALLEALDDMVGLGAQHETTCDPSEHDDSSGCIYCCGRAAIAKVEVGA